MNKRKGFTLIELLAVIVILAIIALIATPIVMNVIENSKKGAAERSAENYIDAVETKVATSRLDGNILEGTYTIDDNGNLTGNGLTKPLIIEMSGTKPTGGTVTIENGQVVPTGTTITIGDYDVSYNEENKAYVATKIMPICELKEGTALAIGSKYECTVKEGETQIFYVLEDGDNTELTPETGGIATSGKVSLIMDRNIDNTTVAWNKSGSNSNGIGTGEGEAGKKLADITSSEGFGWTAVTSDEVSLPTAEQIAKAAGQTFNNETIYSLPTWLYSNFDVYAGPPYAYWTSTPNASNSWSAWRVDYDGDLDNNDAVFIDWDGNYGVRPVITISKSQLG